MHWLKIREKRERKRKEEKDAQYITLKLVAIVQGIPSG